MSTVRRKPNSQFWFAVYRDAHGRWRHRSTKLKSRAQALLVAARLERAFETRLSREQFRRHLAEAYYEINGERIEQATLRDFADAVLKKKRGEIAPDSFKRFEGIVRELLAFLGQTADREVSEVTADDIVRFRSAVAQKSSPANSNYYLKQIRHLFSFANREGLRQDNPASRIGPLKIEKNPTKARRRPFTSDELRKLFDVLSGEWKGLVLFGLYTGQRLGDIAWLTWGSIDADCTFISDETQKTGRWSRVPIAPPLREYLLQRKRGPSSDALFPNASRMKFDAKGQSRRLSAEFHSHLVRAGLAAKRSRKNTGRGHTGARKTSALSFHSLRHNTTSLLKSAGVPEAVVRDIIGHDSEIVSRAYTHMDDHTKLLAVSKLPDVR